MATLVKGQDNEVVLDKMALFSSTQALSDETFIGTERISAGMTVGQSLKAYGTSLFRAIMELRSEGNQVAIISFKVRSNSLFDGTRQRIPSDRA